MNNNRYHSLDTLRGLASLQVVIAHSIVVLPIFLWARDFNNSTAHDIGFFAGNSPLHFIWNSAAAVIVFFVLSGFVLSLPYYNPNKPTPNYLKFFIKRILRLYLPCFAIIVLSLLLKQLVFKPNGANMFMSWLKDFWAEKRSAHQYVQLFLFDGYFNDIDPALWTLPIELKLSLILPFFIYFQRRANLFWSIALVIFCAIFYHTLKHFGVQDKWSDFALFYYSTFFALGSLICKYRISIMAFVNSLSVIYFAIFVICSVLINSYRYNLWFLPVKTWTAIGKAEHYMYGIAGAMFLVIALSNRAYGFFNNKVFLFLGKISFSLYLIHMLVIGTLAFLLNPYLSREVIIVISFCLSFLFGWAYYHLIELPSLKWANLISNKAFNIFYRNTKDKPAGQIV